MFYYDDTIKSFEKNFLWEKSLSYLEEKFNELQSITILNSLIGFSWYYLIEGPVESKKYGNDENSIALEYWNKYSKLAFEKYVNNHSTCFILGYTLLLHGFLLQQYKNNCEIIGLSLINEASKSNNIYIQELAEHIIYLDKSKKIRVLVNYDKICNELFNNGSLIENYFKEILNK